MGFVYLYCGQEQECFFWNSRIFQQVWRVSKEVAAAVLVGIFLMYAVSLAMHAVYGRKECAREPAGIYVQEVLRTNCVPVLCSIVLSVPKDAAIDISESAGLRLILRDANAFEWAL